MVSGKKSNGLLLFGFDSETYKAFCRADHRPAVWVRTGRKVVVENDNGTTIYNHTPLKLSQVDAVLSMELDRELATRVRTEVYPYYLRNINREERCRSVAGTSWADKVSRLEIMINWYHRMLLKHNIDTLVFNNVPHGGSTIALYFLARAMGLRVLLCYQTLFPGLFFIVEDFKDIGVYRTGVAGPVHDEVKPKERPSTPFYMDIEIPGAYSNLATANRLRWRMLGLALSIAENSIMRHFGKEDRVSFRRRELCMLRDRLVFLKQEKTIKTSFDPDRKFVYYPLHYQPELSADVLGGDYANQLQALEELRRVLPDDIHIYVKENPIQSLYCREPSFFQRLNAIPGTTYLRRSVDTFALIEKSWAVATLVGTAGWEAVQMGKPVICFGYAWYRCLPGVLNWPDEFDFDAIENFQFDSDRLRDAVHDMSRYFRPGFAVSKVYSTQVDDFDPVINGDRVVREVFEFLEAKENAADISSQG